jgi:hypothetical protein
VHLSPECRVKDALPGALFAAMLPGFSSRTFSKLKESILIVILHFLVNLFILILYKEEHGISGDSPHAHLNEEE